MQLKCRLSWGSLTYCIANTSYLDYNTVLLCYLQDNGRLTKAHLQSVKYDAKHTVGLVQRAIFGNKELDQAKTTSPSAKKRKGR